MSDTTRLAPTSRPSTPVRTRLVLAGALPGLLLAMFLFASLTDTFAAYRLQDVPVIMLLLACLALAAVWGPTGTLGAVSASDAWAGRSPRRAVAAALLAASAAGTFLVMHDYPLSYDEVMAELDASIFAAGRLAAPMPETWRGYAEALHTSFLLPVDGYRAIVSSYLPGNAWLRAGFDLIGARWLVNPLLLAIAFLALGDVGRRLFPGDAARQGAALVLLALSPQALAAAMTPYAMTPHLALNLVWLALFLRRSPLAQAAAMLVAFLATGLHQIVFHPLFAGPFVLHALMCGRRRVAISHVAAYAVIGLFWSSYHALIVAHLASEGAMGVEAGPGGFFADRVAPLLAQIKPDAVWLMMFNSHRFLAWQHLALLPLVLCAWPLIRRNEGLAAPLAGGIVVAFLAYAVLLPYQGYGWGYRYLHPFLGSFALLGAYGLPHAKQLFGPAGPRLLPVGTLATACLALPWLLVTSAAFALPYPRLDRLIERQEADFVIIDTFTTNHTIDQVRNAADLSNRPIRLAAHRLTNAQLDELCERGTITLIGYEEMAAFRPRRWSEESAEAFKNMKLHLDTADCQVVPIS